MYLSLLLIGLIVPSSPGDPAYPWHEGPIVRRVADIPVPEGFVRVPLPADGFGAWLRGLPLKDDGAPVRLFDGRLKGDQGVHAAVVAIDTGRRDLQQCADAVMRLRGEYLHARGLPVSFDFTSGDPAGWADYAAGLRPTVKGSRVTWSHKAAPRDDYRTFRAYLNLVFAYAGTWSLQKSLKPVADAAPAPGDVYIQGGFPGHAVLVVDACRNGAGETRFLLVQSYMPAQDMHVLRGPDRRADPWYPAASAAAPATPEWRFKRGDLHRFPGRANP